MMIVGMGLIARDGRGTILATTTKVLFSDVDPMVAEALAATHAFITGYELGFQQVIFEGDAQQVVQVINSEKPLQYKLWTSDRRYSNKTPFLV
jgi:ribonuclease HI